MELSFPVTVLGKCAVKGDVLIIHQKRVSN
jgi:hypothetical protein